MSSGGAVGLFKFKQRTITYRTAATAASFTPSNTAGSSEVSNIALIFSLEIKKIIKAFRNKMLDMNINIQLC